MQPPSERHIYRGIILILLCLYFLRFIGWDDFGGVHCLESGHPALETEEKPCAKVASFAKEGHPLASDKKLKSWYEVAKKTSTDKVTKHSYDVAYQKYLPRFFERGSVKMLEIGLGCNMEYGPGESLKVWVEYFKDIKLELHFMEYNRKCAELWQPKFPNIKFHIGDQANESDLQKLIDESGGKFDLIIDDGGHSMKQQIVTMNYLIPLAMKPGGIFVMEDLITTFEGGSFYHDYGTLMTTEFIYSVIDDMHKSWYYPDRVMRKSGTLYKLILGVDCMRGICVFELMPDDSHKSPSMQKPDPV